MGASDGESDDEADAMGPEAQLLMTGTWLTIKELSVVLATLAQHLPFEGALKSLPLGVLADLQTSQKASLLEISDFHKMGDYFLETLTRLKHNGAVEKTAGAFQVVCQRLLQSHLPSFRDLPNIWLKGILQSAQIPDQSRDDIIRRSGGRPFGLAAIFRAEPKHVPKTLLPSGLDSLLEIIQQPDLHSPWTRIHAFHMLRHIFNDKTLATDAAGYLSTGLELSLKAMSDETWEVRNAASLCFATLGTRMVGYKNSIGRGSNQKSISAFEFFFRQRISLNAL